MAHDKTNKHSTRLRQGAAKLLQLVKSARMAEKAAVLALAAITASLFAFIELTDAVLEGEARAFDEFVLQALRSDTDPHDPIGPRSVEDAVRDFTALGGGPVLTALTLAVLGFLLLVRKVHAALFLVAAVGGGVLLSNGFKWLFARPRPDLVPQLADVAWHSFPSGHATLAAVVYLTIGVLLARAYADVRLKLYFLALAATITLAIGASRVYLGVHWPTDVLAGWALGSAWALGCWLAMLWLQRAGKVERGDGRSGGADQD